MSNSAMGSLRVNVGLIAGALIGTLGACGPTPRAAMAVTPTIATAPPAEDALYTSELPPAAVADAAPSPWQCVATPRAATTVQRLFEFEPLPIAASAEGPTIRRMPRGLPARSSVELIGTDGLSGVLQLEKFRACYRWARSARSDLAGPAELAIFVDEFGTITSTVTAAGSGWGELAACLGDVLATRRLEPFIAVPSVIRLPLVFVSTTQAPPDRLPARPVPTRPLSSTVTRAGCTWMATREPTPVDVASALAPLTIDAFDAELEEDRARAERYRATGMRSARQPLVRVGTPIIMRTLDPATVRAVIGYQRGAYGACFAAARAAGLADGTAIKFAATIEPDGRVTGAHAEQSPDEQGTAQCLEAALDQLVMPPSDSPINLRVTLIQAPPLSDAIALPERSSLDHIIAGAAQAATTGHAELAARRYGALLVQLPDEPRACEWRIARIAALRDLSPWIGDDELAEIRALAATVRPADAACIASAVEPLMSIVTTPYQLALSLRRPVLFELALTRLNILAPLAPYLPDLPFFEANVYQSLGRTTTP